MHEFIDSIPVEDIVGLLAVVVTLMILTFLWVLQRVSKAQAPGLVSPQTPALARTATADEYVRRIRVAKEYRTGALQWVTQSRVGLIARALQGSDEELRKIQRDCSHVGVDQTRKTIDAATKALATIAAAEIAIVELKQTIACLDPHAEVEVSLLPDEEEPLETTAKDVPLAALGKRLRRKDVRADMLAPVNPRTDS